MTCIKTEVHMLHLHVYSNIRLNLWLQRILYYALVSLWEKLRPLVMLPTITPPPWWMYLSITSKSAAAAVDVNSSDNDKPKIIVCRYSMIT